VGTDSPDPRLSEAVSRALGRPIERLVDVRGESLAYDAFLANRSVSRVRGTASTPDGPIRWTLIEKVTEGPGIASAYLYDNGLREFRAYASGLLHDLAPGLVAPKAHGVAESADGRLTLWLEDLHADARRMARDDVVDAAGHLGRFAGRWHDRLPDVPWFFTGWIERHGQPESVAPTLERFRALRSRAAIEARTGWRIGAAVELIERQAAIGAVLRRLPETLCHHDAVGANVFRRRRDGEDETVLIDWEMVGPGPIGADLASLIFSSARRGDLSADEAIDLLPAALDAYAHGMADAGFEPNPVILRRAVHAAIGLRWALARDIVVALEDGTPVRRGSAPHESADDAMDQLIRLSRLLLDSASAAV
jgi:hypothetical protein